MARYFGLKRGQVSWGEMSWPRTDQWMGVRKKKREHEAPCTSQKAWNDWLRKTITQTIETMLTLRIMQWVKQRWNKITRSENVCCFQKKSVEHRLMVTPLIRPPCYYVLLRPLYPSVCCSRTSCVAAGRVTKSPVCTGGLDCLRRTLIFARTKTRSQNPLIARPSFEFLVQPF